MTDNKLLLFKLHPCSRGLTGEELEEIADATEIVRDERVTRFVGLISGPISFT